MNDQPLSREECLYWAEFACWTMVLLVPLLWWVNGPAVSTDQLVVRVGLTVLALVGGLSLRVVTWVGKNCEKRSAAVNCEHH